MLVNDLIPFRKVALVAELVDALDSGSSDSHRGGSSPLERTISKKDDFRYARRWICQKCLCRDR